MNHIFSTLLKIIHCQILGCLFLCANSYAAPPELQQPNPPSNLASPQTEIDTDENINALKSIYDDKELEELTKPNPPLKQSPIIETPTPINPEIEAPAITTPEIIAPADEDVPDDQDVFSPKPQQPPPQEPKLMRGKRQFESSFTDNNYSMFFGKGNFAKYLKAIRQVEEEVFLNGGLNTNIIDIEEELLDDDVAEEQTEPEPIIFPYYHLISILYHSPQHWAVMVNGLILTTQKNGPTNELYVRSITPQAVRFVWKPQDYRVFEAANNNNQTPEQFTDNAHFQSVRHRQIKHGQIKGISDVQFDVERRMVSFTLQPNQLFFSEYVRIYEGNPKDILPPPPPPPEPTQSDDKAVIEEGATEDEAPKQDLPNFEELNKSLKENVGKL